MSDNVIQIRLIRVDTRTLGLREDSVLKVIDWIAPTPLPFAPNTVVGIVSVQGRMFTVVDLRVLLEAPQQDGKQIIALRGPEQLALAIDETKSVIEVERVLEGHGQSELFAGKVLVDGNEVSLLNPDTLFAGVIRGRERRRRRL